MLSRGTCDTNCVLKLIASIDKTRRYTAVNTQTP